MRILWVPAAERLGTRANTFLRAHPAGQMHIFFVDDAKQMNCSRPGVGTLVAVGGVVVLGESCRSLENGLQDLCQDAGFPDGQRSSGLQTRITGCVLI
jgi:hypothetical protein